MLMGLLFAGMCPWLCDGLRQVWLSPAASQIASPILMFASHVPVPCYPGSEEEERAPRKLQRTGSQQQRAQRTAQAKQQPESHPM